MDWWRHHIGSDRRYYSAVASRLSRCLDRTGVTSVSRSTSSSFDFAKKLRRHGTCAGWRFRLEAGGQVINLLGNHEVRRSCKAMTF